MCPGGLEICPTVRGSFMHASLHACVKVFIEILHVSGTVLGPWDPSPNKVGQRPCPLGAYVVVGAVRFRPK